ncbi:MAG: hypothetical protein BZY87_09845 [SAR202 cluster bacterium Io17-Chloro-G6]|nr:MAG: hypothetical protein BZY87_09845 [SAR202 cluster bacterium Io17-Chloro-G6]
MVRPGKNCQGLRLKAIAVVGILLLILLAACSGFSPDSRLVDVGGYWLNIRCAGEGVPAVVLEAGLANGNHAWELVEKRVSEFTQVCSYDRAGLGESDAAAGVPTSQTASDDLHALLSGAGITGPLIFVGHSYGGLIVQLYAAQHPEDVAGVILVDSLHPENLDKAAEILGEQSMAALMLGVRGNPEGVDLVASLDLAEASGDLGDIPLTVITAGRPDMPPFIDREVRDQLAGSWLESQRKLAGLSSAGGHVFAEESGHCVQCSEPELVADVIRQMVEAARR